MQNLTPVEAARVLYKAETRMGHAIPEEDLKAGKLAKYLQPEDYTPIQNVSLKLLIYLLGGSESLVFVGVAVSSWFDIASRLLPPKFNKNRKTRPSPSSSHSQLTKLCKS